MSFRPINSRIYNRIRTDNNTIFDTIEIVGEMACKVKCLTGACEIKCQGNVWLDKEGRKFCPHPQGLWWKRIK